MSRHSEGGAFRSDALALVSQVATNPAVRLQTEGVLSALLGTIAVLLSIKALQPPISGTHPCRVYVCACVDVAWRPVER